MEREVLKLDKVSMSFGGLCAVNEVSFSVLENEILSVIGPNGAGKTTLFNIISGVYLPTKGNLLFGNLEIKKKIGIKELTLMIFFGLTFSSMVLILGNIQSLWEEVIVNNYAYRMPFNWYEAIKDLGRFFNSLSFLLLFLVFFVFGSFSAFTVWNRSRVSPEVSAQFGIARTFQNIRLFPKLTVEDNILIGLHRESGIFDLRNKNQMFVSELLKFGSLQDKRNMYAESLPYGVQRRLEIIRALATKPKLILLDEPAAGLNPKEAQDLMDLIKKVRDRGVTVLLIEHHMKVVMRVSNRVVVLNYGNKIAEGTPEEISKNPQVIEAYLGKSVH